MARRYPLKTRFQRDIGELESYFENFARRHPGLTCCMLRYQPEIGPGLDTPLVRYLTLPVVPTQLGFDPRLQLVHADDATGALRAASATRSADRSTSRPTGTISLTKILRLAGRPAAADPAPLFAPPLLGRLGQQARRRRPLRRRVRLLRYGRGVDNARLRSEVGYAPAFDAEARSAISSPRSRGRRRPAPPGPRRARPAATPRPPVDAPRRNRVRDDCAPASRTASTCRGAVASSALPRRCAG